MQHFPYKRLVAHILLFSHLLSSCGRPSYLHIDEAAPFSLVEAPPSSSQAEAPVSRSFQMDDKRQRARRQSAENPSILNVCEGLSTEATQRAGCLGGICNDLVARSLVTIHYPISHPLLPWGTTLHFKQDNQCFVASGAEPIFVVFESGFTAEDLVRSDATWQEQHIHPYPSLADNKKVGFFYIGHHIHTEQTTFTTKENYTIAFTATSTGLAAKVSFPALGDGSFIKPVHFAPGHSLSTFFQLPKAVQLRALALVNVSRPLSPCAYAEEVTAATERRTAAYSNVISLPISCN